MYKFDGSTNIKNNKEVKNKIIVILLRGSFYFSNIQPSKAIGLSMPSVSMIRVRPSYQYESKVQIANVIPRKKDLIV